MRREAQISVMLPVRNGTLTLRAALESIRTQTFTDWVCIVVDDHSTDASAGIIEEAVAADPRFVHLKNAGSGIVDALNTAIAGASSPYLARMDADDISLPHRLERQIRFLEENPETGLVSCLVKHDGEAGKQAGYARYVKWINSLLTAEEITLNRFVESPMAHPSVMFRRKLVSLYGGYLNGPFPEDYEIWLRWLQAGVRMQKVPETLYIWTDRTDRLSRTDPRYSVMAFYDIKSGYLAKWLERNNPHHPDVVVWGAGRTTRQRVKLLQQKGIRVSEYIDINPGRAGTRIAGIPVFMPDGLPGPSKCFVLSYVGSVGARALIAAKLAARGFTMGENWLPVA
jgi:glycosyltransferase involved in cell wall biosynthesis